MSKELADSIVLAAQKMERNEVEVISVIRHVNRDCETYCISCPVKKDFESFDLAYNYLAMKGYRRISLEEYTHFKILLEVAKEVGRYPIIMVMSKKVNKE
jgi:hypothetical protein